MLRAHGTHRDSCAVLPEHEACPQLASGPQQQEPERLKGYKLEDPRWSGGLVLSVGHPNLTVGWHVVLILGRARQGRGEKGLVAGVTDEEAHGCYLVG